MVSPAVNPSACWEFEGEILVLHHPTTISSRYQAMGKSHPSLLIYYPKPEWDLWLFLRELFNLEHRLRSEWYLGFLSESVA